MAMWFWKNELSRSMITMRFQQRSLMKTSLGVIIGAGRFLMYSITGLFVIVSLTSLLVSWCLGLPLPLCFLSRKDGQTAWTVLLAPVGQPELPVL